ncbi:MAG: asparagine synthase (glutamine-hydrolyzing) [Gammaproteobacteria bacterium]|nr:asparagine synthase (glutamine-hydrolyzing) [Gammaproteobacteria bacterium]
MCGIAGIVNLTANAPITEHDLGRMAVMLDHRGPDDRSTLCGDMFGFAHTRLSIIDLAGGRQPIHNEDSTVWVVFNGEIFNYIELRELLLSKGHRFYTHTDTEVIVHLYEEYGDDFVRHLNGQFAIALWDTVRRRLLLVRDRPGILPLFYSVNEGRLFFASEMKSILAGTRQSPRIDTLALDQIMTFWSVLPPRTLFQGIETLAPGEMMVVENGVCRKHRYWDWSFTQPGDYAVGSEAELAGQLRELLLDATIIRLRSDVPVGAYLSGGLDSSILAGLIDGIGDIKLRTFSITFPGSDLDESVYQEQVIEQLSSEHSRVVCTPENIADEFIKTLWHTEAPILRTAPVPMGILSGLVRSQGYKVVLTGEGADEVFGGYDIFKEAKIRQFWARKPDSRLRPMLLKRLYPYLDLSKDQAQGYLQSFFGIGLDNPQLAYFSHLPRWVTTAKCKAFYSSDLHDSLREDPYAALAATLPDAIGGWATFNRAQYIESKTLMSGYLLSSQGDRMLMKNSIEGRFPYLDHRVIEFANRLDPRLKMKVLQEKYLLKRSMQDRVPRAILERHKQPYRAPDADSFRNAARAGYVDELLDPGYVRGCGYFDPQKVSLLKKKLDKGLIGSAKDNMALIGILSTQALHKLFIDDYSANIGQYAERRLQDQDNNVQEVCHVG